MQQLSADNEDLHGDSMKAAHEINHSTFTEEVADLIEDSYCGKHDSKRRRSNTSKWRNWT